MKTLTLTQGSSEWHAHRAQHWNASDAPAMMGCSPYESRNQLLQRLATGIAYEVDAATQHRFDEGHRLEALARPLAEKFIGETFYPVTGTEGRYSASFDGLTMDEETAFECKTLNDSLRYKWDEGNGAHLPEHYQVQMEHQLMVSGAKRVLFFAVKAEGDEITEQRQCWYASNPRLRAKIAAGWEQFEADLAAYVSPEAAAPAAIGHTPETLPALRIEVTGMVTGSNLAEYKAHALAVFGAINKELTTDQHFADAAKTVKWCGEVETRLAAAKQHALSQTASIDELFRTVDDISAEARRVRLELEKLVEARKLAIKGEIVAGGMAALRDHIAALNQRIGKPLMPVVPADFGACIRGLRTVDGLRNAVDTELARAKIEANAIADRIQVNLTLLQQHQELAFLFADVAQIALKANDDFAALVSNRIAAHQAAEAAREEATRQKIRAEEQERADREAQQALADARAADARIQAENDKAQAAIDAARQANALPTPLLDGLSKAAAFIVSDGAADVAIATAQNVVAFNRPDTSARIKLGDINARIAPIALTADGLAQLGFVHVAQDKAAKLYREADFPLMCAALVNHIQAVQAKQAA